MRTRCKLNLSVDEETRDRLQQYAYDHHTTISQAITDWIWSQKVSDSKPLSVLEDEVERRRKRKKQS